jgi:hypothetical protein
MRTLQQIGGMWPDEQARRNWTRQHADAFAMMKANNGVAWRALEERMELAIAEANDEATHPDTDEVKRAGWAGRERGLRDLHQELSDLYSGAWKEWPEMRTERTERKKGEEEE